MSFSGTPMTPNGRPVGAVVVSSLWGSVVSFTRSHSVPPGNPFPSFPTRFSRSASVTCCLRDWPNPSISLISTFLPDLWPPRRTMCILIKGRNHFVVITSCLPHKHLSASYLHPAWEGGGPTEMSALHILGIMDSSFLDFFLAQGATRWVLCCCTCRRFGRDIASQISFFGHRRNALWRLRSAGLLLRRI